MQTEFQNAGVRYSIQVIPKSLREVEAQAQEIKPDPELWTPAEKKKHGLTHKAPHRRLSFLDDEAEIRKRHNRAGRERSLVVAQPKPEDFTDRPEYR